MTALTTNLGAAKSDGTPVTFDIRKAPHMLIAGTTGSGKSVAIHAILADLLTTCMPHDLGLVLIDPKRVELSDYAGIPHLAGPTTPSGTFGIYRDPLDALAALEWVLAQVEVRFCLMQEHNVRDASKIPVEALRDSGQPRSLLLVVDELADLMMATGSLSKAQRMRLTDPEITLARILQIGRAAGVHAILATQRPSSDIVTGVIKANVPTRLTFALQNATDSRVAMGRKGAEELAGKGDALFLPVGAREAIRLQGKFVPDEERLALVAQAKEQEPLQSQTAGTTGPDSGARGSRPSGAQANPVSALSLADMPLPVVPAVLQVEAQDKRGERLQRRALRRYRRQAERVGAWNEATKGERRVATGMALLCVWGFLGLVLAYWLVLMLR